MFYILLRSLCLANNFLPRQLFTFVPFRDFTIKDFLCQDVKQRNRTLLYSYHLLWKWKKAIPIRRFVKLHAWMTNVMQIVFLFCLLFLPSSLWLIRDCLLCYFTVSQPGCLLLLPKLKPPASAFFWTIPSSAHFLPFLSMPHQKIHLGLKQRKGGAFTFIF